MRLRLMLLMFALTARTAWALAPALDVGTAISIPGGSASITVTLTRNSNAVVATSNDIGFDSTVLSITPTTDCMLNTTTAPGFSAPLSKTCHNGFGSGTGGICSTDSDCIGSNMPPCDVVRIGIFNIPTQVIPKDGVLVTCLFLVSPSAAAGSYALTNSPDAFDPHGNPFLGTTGSPGAVIVPAASPAATATPTATLPLANSPTGTPTGEPASTPTNTPPPTNTPTSAPTTTRTLSATPSITPTATLTPIAAQCVGDCDGSGEVSVDELISLVNIALGNAEAPTCPHGIPDGSSIDISLIVQAVNDALSNCPASRSGGGTFNAQPEGSG